MLACKKLLFFSISQLYAFCPGISQLPPDSFHIFLGCIIINIYQYKESVISYFLIIVYVFCPESQSGSE